MINLHVQTNPLVILLIDKGAILLTIGTTESPKAQRYSSIDMLSYLRKKPNV